MLPGTLILLSLAVQSTTAPPEVSTSSPIDLFNQVCLADEVQLTRGKFVAAKYADIPHGAKEALGFSLPKERFAPPGAKGLSLRDDQVPNRFFAVRATKQTYLVLAANSGLTGRAADHCAVLWNGRDYPAAVKAVRAVRPISPEVDSEPVLHPIPGYGFTLVRSKGAVLAATEFGDWTILRVGPDRSPEEQITR